MAFVAEGVDAEPIWQHLKSQVFLGNEDFVARSLKQIKAGEDMNIPRAQRRPPPLKDVERQYGERDAVMVAAHASGDYSYQQIDAHFGVHFTTVAKEVRRAKGRGGAQTATQHQSHLPRKLRVRVAHRIARMPTTDAP
ncbi:MAG: hypothetical protein ACLGG1_06070 [Gammaproteobacteria bacterium]